VDVVADLPADAQPAEPVQQGDGLLDDPAAYAQAGAVRDAAAADVRGDTRRADLPAALVMIVDPVCIQRRRSMATPAASAAHQRDGVDQR
jgi:hypothetical protein